MLPVLVLVPVLLAMLVGRAPHRKAANGQWSAVSCQRPAISSQRSEVGDQCSAGMGMLAIGQPQLRSVWVCVVGVDARPAAHLLCKPSVLLRRRRRHRRGRGRATTVPAVVVLRHRGRAAPPPLLWLCCVVAAALCCRPPCRTAAAVVFAAADGGAGASADVFVPVLVLYR